MPAWAVVIVAQACDSCGDWALANALRRQCAVQMILSDSKPGPIGLRCNDAHPHLLTSSGPARQMSSPPPPVCSIPPQRRACSKLLTTAIQEDACIGMQMAPIWGHGAPTLVLHFGGVPTEGPFF